MVNARREFMVLLCAAVLGLGFACVDEAALPVFAKFLAASYNLSSDDVLRHEMFLPHHLGFENNHIVVLGSCQLLSVWHNLDLVKPSFSIPRLLEWEFRRHGQTHVRVINLCYPKFVTGYNLHMFLRLLHDSRCKVFIWHNDFSPAQPKLNALFGDPYVCQQLSKLEKDFRDPDLEAAKRIACGSSRPPDEVAYVTSDLPDIGEEMQPSKIFRSLKENVVTLVRNPFAEVTVNMLKKNTKGIRQMVDAVYERLHVQETPPDGGTAWKSLPDYNGGPHYRLRKGDSVYSADTLNGDNVMSVRLIGKLAQRYGKKVYLYFGPEGRAGNEVDRVYTEKYKRPLLRAVKGLPAVGILDLTDLPIDPVDTWGLVHLTASGNKKAAAQIYSLLSKDGYVGSL